MAFGDPVDPAYTRFLAGLEQIAADPSGRGAWRWHPPDGKWYDYPRSTWVLEEIGMPDTPPGSAFQGKLGCPRPPSGQ